jgi:hypothetical protein
VVQLLAENKVNVNAKNKRGKTAHLVAYKEQKTAGAAATAAQGGR